MNKRTIATYLATTLSFALLGCDGGGGASTEPTGEDTGKTNTAPPNVIDNMEDPDEGGSILESEGRVGAWYTFNDKTPEGIQTPPADAFEPDVLEVPREGSTYAARSTGEGFTKWGAGFGFDLKNDGTSKLPYNATAYQGITFWAMTSEGNTPDVRVTFNDVSTSPEGGVCKPEVKDNCDDHFGANIVLQPGVWTEHTLMFDTLAQDGWGAPVETFSPDALYAIQFTVLAGQKFDIWIDDIAFVE